MDFFWGNVFEYFKDRRLGGLFVSALAAFFGAAIVGAILYHVCGDAEWLQYWPQILPAALLLLAFLGWRTVRKYSAARRANRYQSTPLSRDEWVKARRKLGAKPVGKKR